MMFRSQSIQFQQNSMISENFQQIQSACQQSTVELFKHKIVIPSMKLLNIIGALKIWHKVLQNVL